LGVRVVAKVVSYNWAGSKLINDWIGVTAETTAWLASHTTLNDGSTYRELDGSKRIYQLYNGTWYEL